MKKSSSFAVVPFILAGLSVPAASNTISFSIEENSLGQYIEQIEMKILRPGSSSIAVLREGSSFSWPFPSDSEVEVTLLSLTVPTGFEVDSSIEQVTVQIAVRHEHLLVGTDYLLQIAAPPCEAHCSLSKISQTTGNPEAEFERMLQAAQVAVFFEDYSGNTRDARAAVTHWCQAIERLWSEYSWYWVGVPTQLEDFVSEMFSGGLWRRRPPPPCRLILAADDQENLDGAE